jgi:hypothetical protein
VVKAIWRSSDQPPEPGFARREGSPTEKRRHHATPRRLLEWSLHDKLIGEGRLDKTVPVAFTSGMDIGRAARSGRSSST